MTSGRISHSTRMLALIDKIDFGAMFSAMHHFNSALNLILEADPGIYPDTVSVIRASDGET